VNTCTSPRCPCSGILFHCTPLSPEGTATPQTYEFWLSAPDNSVEPQREARNKSEATRLGQAVLAALTEEDRIRLNAWVNVQKRALLRQVATGDLDCSALPDASDGLMIPFVEVFPWELAHYFEIGGEVWASDDQHCVNPVCDCTDVFLSFYRLQDASGIATKKIEDSPTVLYDYKSGEFRVEHPGSGDHAAPGELLAALKKEWPGLNHELHYRHLLLRNLYARAHENRLKQENADLKSRLYKDVGRNDPCPCGSGKKFKRCCLGK
jgi:hypothetical protein